MPGLHGHGLHARDYERMLDLTVAVLEHDDPGSLWYLISGHLVDALGLNTVVFAVADPARGRGEAQGWAPQSLGQDVSAVVQRRVRQHHPLVSYLAARAHRPVTASELCDDWRDSPWYSEAHRDYGTTQQLGVPVPAGDGTLRGLVLGRVGDFTDHELAFAARIQPLLITADRHTRELRRLREAASPQAAPTPLSAPAPFSAPVAFPAAAAPRHDLTPRELTVLGLLAEGLTAVGIAHRLAISPHTVNRHLEKVYRKLGTNNRVATVLSAQQAGIVPRARIFSHPADRG
ncbi:helix-turn-helix transcriptional regulator [Streptomyces sp. NPDC037389]|uniref:helix-turn-helix transcriptional regulator n=1 Tax=Streptomyces sp. NPDC037389 TaxID=3155369 RepID=UPI00340B9E97